MAFDLRFTWEDVRKDRIAILTVLATIVGIFLLHTVWLGPHYLETEQLVSQVTNQEKLIEKFQKKLAQGKGMKEKLEEQEGELKNLRKGLFQGGDPYQLAASLGELLSPKGSQDLSMKSYQVLDSKEYGLYQQVRLKFYFTASIQGLHQFLQSLEERGTVLGIEQMDVRKGGGKNATDLVVNVTISALMEKGEKSDRNKI